jgi:hypothetical protein
MDRGPAFVPRRTGDEAFELGGRMERMAETDQQCYGLEFIARHTAQWARGLDKKTTVNYLIVVKTPLCSLLVL